MRTEAMSLRSSKGSFSSASREVSEPVKRKGVSASWRPFSSNARSWPGPEPASALARRRVIFSVSAPFSVAVTALKGSVSGACHASDSKPDSPIDSSASSLSLDSSPESSHMISLALFSPASSITSVAVSSASPGTGSGFTAARRSRAAAASKGPSGVLPSLASAARMTGREAASAALMRFSAVRFWFSAHSAPRARNCR